ncbi:MAG: choice-of-anchor tandem repeat GloVer-containing protein, partial [Candidatus Korobacteraceae bacterium]
MSMANPGQHRIWILETGRRAAAAGLALAIMLALTLGATEAVQAQTFQVIHDFTGGVDGSEPNFGLTIDAAGNLYGTTFAAQAGTGTAYKLAHKTTGWALTPLYVFTITSNGVIPYSTLVIGRDGKLYGTTGFGGIGPCLSYGHSGCGTVFSLRTPGTFCHTSYCPWIETPLYKFSGGSDGSNPYGAAVVFDAAGNLYGTTYGGGGGSCSAGGCGVVYKLTPAGSGWTESTVYTFTGGADGAAPWAGVTLDQAGNLYGTTSAGGAFGGG